MLVVVAMRQRWHGVEGEGDHCQSTVLLRVRFEVCCPRSAPGSARWSKGRARWGHFGPQRILQPMRLHFFLMGVALRKKNVKKSFTNCDFAHPLEGDLWAVAGCAGY